MSAPPRAPRDGTTTPARGRGRASNRAGIDGRGRGRGSGNSATMTNPSPIGLLQSLRTGTLNKNGGLQTSSSRGARGHGNAARNQSTSQARATLNPPAPTTNSRPSSPAPSSHKDFMNDMSAKFQVLKQRREAERAKAIRDGFLADPEKKTSLDKAITPVGTCTEMCPEFERIERIVQNMVDKSEKIQNQASGRDIPSEARMIKRFRRSAAGYDEQLPSDIRTPATLKTTLDYLLDKVIGTEERLAPIHKFVWDRTRGIRNDFSIQQVSKEEDVRIAVDCFERIARFHMLSLHQLSNPDNLQEGENFDAHQDREQLNNTLLSLIYYYDDYRDKIDFPNEAEFRAYCIVFELQSQHPDLEDRMQSWPKSLLDDGRVKTAFKLFSAAGNTIFDQGPLRPLQPCNVAQGNAGSFWTILQSRAVSYLMACVAEIYFSQVRFTALEGLWSSARNAPASMRAKIKDWTLPNLSHLLAFDDQEQTYEFCQALGLTFREGEKPEEQYLEFPTPLKALDQSLIPKQQIFSDLVEQKRFRRTLVAVINGVSVPRAIKEGLVVAATEHSADTGEQAVDDDVDGLFVPQNSSFAPQMTKPQPAFVPSAQATSQAPTFASTFAKSPLDSSTFSSSRKASGFGQPSGFETSSAFTSPSGFGAPSVTATPSGFGTHSGFGKPSAVGVPSGFGAPSTTAKPIFQFASSSSITQPSVVSLAAAPSSVNGGLSQSSPFNLNRTVPAATDSATTSTSAPVFTFNPIVKPLSYPSSSLPTSQASPSIFQFSAPKDAASLPAFSWQNSTPNTVLSPEAAAHAPKSSLRPDPIIFPLSPLSSFPVQSNHETKPSSDPSPTAAAEPVRQPPQFTAPDQPPPSPRPAKRQLQSGVTQLPLFPTPSSTNTPAQQPEGFPLFTQPFTASQNLPPSQSPVPPKSFTSQSPTAPPQPPLFDFMRNSHEDLSGPSSRAIPSSSRQDRDFETSPKSAASQTFPTPPATSVSASLPSQSLGTPIAPAEPVQQGVSAAERERTIDATLQLALLQEHGLMTEFVEHVASKMLPPIFKLWEESRIDALVKANRTKLLAKKYGLRWKKLTWHNYLQRKAKIRRKAYEDFYAGEKEKRLREEKWSKELQEILKAQEESRIVQEEIRKNQMKEEQERQKRQDAKARKSREMLYGSPEINRKRKSIGDEPERDSAQGETPRKIIRTHRRSRTVGGIEQDKLTEQKTQAPLGPGRRISMFSGKESQFGQFVPDPPNYQRSMSKTKTDYFRLKALGIDPETPIVPHTEASLAKKQKRDAEEHEKWLASVYARSRMRRPTPPSTKSPSPEANVVPKTMRPVTPIQNTEGFKMIAEIKAMMEEGTQWYKEQTAILKEECAQQEQQEELRRRSTSSYDSIYNPQLDADGLATAPTGYKYRPDNTPPGQPLSRTEMRIRMTGARGLATAPVGGTPGYTSKPNPRREYFMDTLRPGEAEKLKALTNGSGGKEGKAAYADQSLQALDLGTTTKEPVSPLQSTGSPRHQHHQPRQHQVPMRSTKTQASHNAPSKQTSFSTINGAGLNPYAALGNLDNDEDDEDELDEEEAYANGLLDEDEAGLSASYLESDGRFDGDDEDDEEELEQEYDEDEDEDENENEEEFDSEDGEEGEDMENIAKHAYLRLPRGGDSQMMSRGTSGTGASVEDALVLDSD